MRVIVPKILQLSDLISTNLADSAEAEYDYSGETSYSAGTIIKVSYESDGVTPVFPVKLFESVQTNTSYPPDNVQENDSDYDYDWVDLGGINQHKMFDQFLNTQAVADGSEASDPGKIVIVLDASFTDTAGLANMDSSIVTFELFDEDGVCVHNEIVENPGTWDDNWEDFWFTELNYNSTMYHEYPFLLNSQLRITIEHEQEDEYSALGALKIGTNEYVGQTLKGIGAGFMDFSYNKHKDDGTIEFKKKDYASTMRLTVESLASEFDRIYEIFGQCRGIPTLWIGNNDDMDFSTFIVYGFLASYNPIISNSHKCEFSADIDGMKFGEN